VGMVGIDVGCVIGVMLPKTDAGSRLGNGIPRRKSGIRDVVVGVGAIGTTAGGGAGLAARGPIDKNRPAAVVAFLTTLSIDC
jgi:hypothetical protein